MSSNPPPPEKSALAPIYYLKLSDHAIQIAPEGLIIGRSPSCDVAINDGQVSRRHARVSIGKGRPVIEDLGSANGVYVNGERLTAPRALRVGDLLLIGGSRFELATDTGLVGRLDTDTGREVKTADDLPLLSRSARPARHERASDDGMVPRLYVEERETQAASELPSSEQTRRVDVLVLFGQVAEKMLAGGQVVAAEQLLRPRLKEVLAETKAGRRDAGELIEIAAEHAVRLAGATGRAEWVDYVFGLYSSVARPPPIRIVDELHKVVRKVPRIHVVALRDYLGTLSNSSHRLTPAERFVLQRLRGLAEFAETK